ncbi:MAG TPA: serine hydrolase domain-containing protein [Saprospiraceae bacterium]|nr:serine hydrolase domain-containing protein [Saprospiraceae bacterium]
MKKTTLILFLLSFLLPLCILAQPLTTVVPESVGLSSQRLDRLSTTFQEYVDEEQLSGSVVLVMRKGKPAYFKAFGKSDLEQQRPMKKNAIFRIASQSKALISVGIMMLQEEGKLLITDPLSKYLPAFRETTVAESLSDGGYMIVEAERAITLRDLLTHTAGIGYGYGPASDAWAAAGIQGWYFANRDEPIQATVNRMAALPFDAQPGERFVYGYNTDVLGAVIEVASGMPLDEFLRKRILDPLDMQDTHFYLPPAKADRLATVYSLNDGKLYKANADSPMQNQGAYVKGPRKSFSGGAGLLSTAEDYATFLQMMLNEGTYQGQRLLSRKTVELMTTSHLPEGVGMGTPGTGFGLGFSVLDDLGQRGTLGTEGEFAWGGAYHSEYWVDPAEELVVVYFTQLIPANGIDDHQKLRALIYQAIVD